MSEFFLKIVNMSISASWLVLAVLLLRLVLKKAPKWVSVLLWGFVALRLLMPFSIESNFSLIPGQLTNGQIISNVGDVYIGETDTIGIYEGHEQQTGQQSVGSFVAEQGSIKPPKTVGNTVYPILSWIWLAGVAAMLIYTAISYILLRRKVATAVLLRKNIFQSENVDSPFVLGIITPKIYLPFRMDDPSLDYVIAHEESHIRRKDHWWKPFGFVLLAIHWFNPLMWLGYILLCRDIELACDEKVIKEMDNENKANYTEALVAFSIHRRSIAACPLAFGEVGVKERVKSVMNYRKPAFWIIIAAMIICIIVAVCFLTNPTDSYGIGIQSIRGTTYTESNDTPAIELDYFLLLDGEDTLRGGQWLHEVSKDEPERTKDGSIPYDGSLGKYRMMIELPKTGPSASFRKSHEEGTVYTLEGMPGSFEDSVYYKVVYPEEGGMIIYIGSDVPFRFRKPGMSNDRYIRGPLKIRLVQFTEHHYEPVVKPQQPTDIVKTITTNLKTYYQLRDGRWKVDGRIYQYRHELVGRMSTNEVDSTFVYLSNLETISFDQAWRAAGLSSNSADYFKPEEAVLVDWENIAPIFDISYIPDDELLDENTLADMPVTWLDAMIADTILKLSWDTESDALLNTEGHIILGHETVSGTPTEGQTNHSLEEILFVHYVKQRYRVVNGYQEECGRMTGTAVITFGTDDRGLYYLKEFRNIRSSADFDGELKQKFASATQMLAENKSTYEIFLDAFSEVGIFLEHLRAYGPTAPGGIMYGPRIENAGCNYGGDGKRDFFVTTAVEMLRPWEG